MTKEEKEFMDKQVDLEEAIEVETQLAERGKQLLDISQRFDKGRDYNLERLIEESKFYKSTMAQSAYELGNRLLVIKEYEKHGDFMDAVENRVGISIRQAQRWMQIAFKLSHTNEKNASALSQLGTTKLLDLMDQDIDDLSELAEGGTIAGLTLNEIDTASTRELKAKLKEAKEDQDAVRKVSVEKDKKINDLSEKLEKAEAKAKREIKKLELEESETDRLMKSYQLTLVDITSSISVEINKLNQLFSEASKNVLPDSFFREMSLKTSEANEGLNSLLMLLPTDASGIDTDWMKESKEALND